MKLLHIETSGVNCSVALTDNNTLLATKAQNAGHFTHSENLHLFIETVMTTAGVPLSSLDAIAVSAGAFPEAKDMIPFAVEKYKAADFEDIAYFEPTYLK